VLQHLKTAGFKKSFGFTRSYLFQLVFVLLFHHKNCFGLLESKKGEAFPGKDVVYRFLSHSGYSGADSVFSRYILLAWQHRQHGSLHVERIILPALR